MKKLGNIVTDNINEKYDEIFNVYKSCEDIDNDLPTLYIGFKKAKSCINGFSILKKEYKDQNCWWTFKKMERREDYINDIYAFKRNVILNSLSSVKYRYINFTMYSLARIKKLIDYIWSERDKTCFLTKNSQFIFIYDESLSTVFGLSLTLCDYVGVSKRKVINQIKSNRRNHFIYDISFLNEDLKRIIEDNTHYILPLYFYFKMD